MLSEEQFDTTQDRYRNAKDIYNQSLKNLLSEAPNFTKETLNDTYTKYVKFSSEFETFLTRISSEHQTLSSVQIKDILTTIENILESSIESWKTLIGLYQAVLGMEITPQKNFLKTAQAILKTYNKKKALYLQQEFEKNNIPIEGFISKEKYKLTTSKIEWPSLIFGIIFLIIAGGIIFFDFIHTGMQYWLTRIFASIGFALLITGIFKGTIQTKINVPGVAITATGAFAFFLVLYFSNPAEQPKYTQSEKIPKVIKVENNNSKPTKVIEEAKNNLNVNHNNLTNSNLILQTGNHNSINITSSKKVDFLRPFLIEKNSNLPLLYLLTKTDGETMQKLAYDPKYLNTRFLKSFDIYQEIQDDKTLNALVDLLKTLEDINTKIRNLSEANKNILITGSMRDMLGASTDFSTVNEESERALSLYEQISSSYKEK